MLRALANWGRRTGLDQFVLWKYGAFKERLRQATVIVEQEINVPAKDAGRRVLVQGRSVCFAYGADGQMHLRRRPKQIKREFGSGFQWRAMPKEEPCEPIRRFQYPWWWLH